jgi:hypothetical protein
LACGLCGKQVTLQYDLGAGRKKIAVLAEPLEKLDVDRSVFGAGDIIAIPLPNIGSMGGEAGRFEGATAGKAVPSNLLQIGGVS